jgi:hypothetical protein
LETEKNETLFKKKFFYNYDMDQVPKEVRNIILTNLDGVDYVHAIESCHYWNSGVVPEVYESKKQAYVTELKKRKRREMLDESMGAVKKIFAGDGDNQDLLPATVAPMMNTLPQQTRNGAVALIESDLFRNLLMSMMDRVDDMANPQAGDLATILQGMMGGPEMATFSNIINGAGGAEDEEEEIPSPESPDE